VNAELVAFIAAEPGLADRLLAEHRNDGSGRCRVCTGGAQAGRYQWPCAIHRAATDASTPDGVGDNAMIGDW
jgi:hypothetical protein